MANANDLWDIEDDDDDIIEDPIEQTEEGLENEVEDDDDDEEDNKEESEQSDESEVSPFIAELLKSKGFEDPSKITVINENGEEEVVSFNDLDDEDKAAILSNDDNELQPAEVEALNFMRQNRMTMKDIAEYYMEVGRKQALEVADTNYTVDDYSDEELFVADLQNRFDDLTEEEILEYIERAKANEGIFKKQCDKLRNEYKAIEDAEKEKAQASIAAQSEAEYRQIVTDMNDIANKVDSINDMILEDEDKVDILKFILDKDVEGKTPIIKAIEDPETLYKVAWFILKGEEANASIVKYFNAEIEKLKSTKPKEKQVKPSIDSFKKEPNKKKKYNSLYDLYTND